MSDIYYDLLVDIEEAKRRLLMATSSYDKIMASMELRRVKEVYVNVKRFNDNWEANKAAYAAYDASFNTPSTNSVDIIAPTVPTVPITSTVPTVPITSTVPTVPISSTVPTVPISSTVPTVIAENNSMSECTVTSEPVIDIATKKIGESNI